MTTYLLSYDIRRNRTRAYIVKILKKHGCQRLQKSVFLAPKFAPMQLQRLRHDLQRYLRLYCEHSDSFVCIPIEQDDLLTMLWVGNPQDVQDMLKFPTFWLL